MTGFEVLLWENLQGRLVSAQLYIMVSNQNQEFVGQGLGSHLRFECPLKAMMLNVVDVECRRFVVYAAAVCC